MTAAATGVELTRAFAASPYRVGRHATARYYPCTTNITCDECAGRQHEAGSAAVGARARARTKRVIAHNGPALFLCGADAQRWRERDATDMAAPR